MPFLIHSDQDIEEMLKEMGVDDIEQLLSNIPRDLRFKGSLKIPQAISEIEITQVIESLAQKNQLGISFLGGGAYDHYIPAVIDSIISRSEFYTAYTPYQPEVSQGTLQSIYEFQSMICELTHMDVTNASMYDGGSALAEAMLLACHHTGKKKVLVSESLNYRYRNILHSYVRHNDIEIDILAAEHFRINLQALQDTLTDEVAAVIVQQPNYFGYLEEVFDISSILQNHPALFIVHYDPISLGLLAPPGEYGADIAVAEGQSLGNSQNFGGPFIGLFSTRQEFIRRIPGRLSGLTQDRDGNQGFVLTLQTREQHIRREKATSNICTNSGLLALAATVYLAVMGKEGLKEVAHLCLQKSHYLADQLTHIAGIVKVSDAPFFKEFVVKFPISAKKILHTLKGINILGGISLRRFGYDNHLLITVTEKRSKQEMDNYVSKIKQTLGI
jgi:glycine dehydrogenase subunit 1